jgi:cathepsin B
MNGNLLFLILAASAFTGFTPYSKAGSDRSQQNPLQSQFLKPIQEVVPSDLRRLEAFLPPYNFLEKFPQCELPIRIQDHCGSCWAFGSSEAFANRICRSTGINVGNISPQELVSCVPSGCAGGSEVMAWKYFMDTGIHTEDVYPYVSGKDMITGACLPPSTGTIYKSDQAVVIQPSILAIQTEIQNKGPVTCPMNAYIDLMIYKKGIYRRETNINLGGHVVTVIGWGQEEGVNYWLVKNLWGLDWGEKGYFRIEFGQCGIESSCIAGNYVP